MAKYKQNGKTLPNTEQPPPTHKEDPLLSMAEVARQIGKSPQTIARWCRDGLLEHCQLRDGLPTVRQSQVNKMLAASQLDVQAVAVDAVFAEQQGKKKD